MAHPTSILVTPPVIDLASARYGATYGAGQSEAVRLANGEAWLAALARTVSGGRGRVVVPIEGTLEVAFSGDPGVTVPAGTAVTLLSRTGDGRVKFFPDFQPFGWSPLRLGAGATLEAFGLTLEGPDHPFLVVAPTCGPQPSSAVLARVSGPAFDAAYHAGATVDVNYYTTGGTYSCVQRTVLSVDSADQVTLSSALPADVDGAREAPAGIRVDGHASADHRAHLVAEGSRWIEWGEDRGATAVRATATTGAGLVLLSGVTLLGAWTTAVSITGAGASLETDACHMEGEATKVSLFPPDGAIAAGRETHWHDRASEIVGGGYTPAGRNPLYWSPTIGHACYNHPNLNLRLVGTTIRDALGAVKLGYSENEVQEVARYSEVIGATFDGIGEGIYPMTAGAEGALLTTFRDCDISTWLVLGWGARVEGGTLSAGTPIHFVHGNFGSARHLPGERLVTLRGVAVHCEKGLALFRGGYADLDEGDEDQSFRVVYDGCAVTVDQVAGQERDLVEDDDPHNGSHVVEQTLELRGGTLDLVYGRGFGALRGGELFQGGPRQYGHTTLRLTGGVALTGEPSDGYWVDPGEGTLEATDYDLSGSNTPLTPP